MGFAVAALAGLRRTKSDRCTTQFYREAGALIDTGEFGNATMNNTLIMTGEKQYTYDLSQRFASEVMTTVNFAFNSAQFWMPGRSDTCANRPTWIRQFPEVRFRSMATPTRSAPTATTRALACAARALLCIICRHRASAHRVLRPLFPLAKPSPYRDRGQRAPQPPHRDRSVRLCVGPSQPCWTANMRRSSIATMSPALSHQRS